MPLPLPKLNDDLPLFYEPHPWGYTAKLPYAERHRKEIKDDWEKNGGEDFRQIPGATKGMERNSRGQLRFLSPVPSMGPRKAPKVIQPLPQDTHHTDDALRYFITIPGASAPFKIGDLVRRYDAVSAVRVGGICTYREYYSLRGWRRAEEWDMRPYRLRTATDWVFWTEDVNNWNFASDYTLVTP